MNLGRSEYTRLMRIEVKYKKLLELNQWVLEVSEFFTQNSQIRPVPEVMYVSMEAYRELFEYTKELSCQLK